MVVARIPQRWEENAASGLRAVGLRQRVLTPLRSPAEGLCSRMPRIPPAADTLRTSARHRAGGPSLSMLSPPHDPRPGRPQTPWMEALDEV